MREGQRWKPYLAGKPSDSTSPFSILPSHLPRRFSYLALILLLILCRPITLSLSCAPMAAYSPPSTQSSHGEAAADEAVERVAVRKRVRQRTKMG